MYTILYDGLLLHDPRTEDRRCRDATFHLEVSAAGSGTMTVDVDHPVRASLRMLKGVLELRSDEAAIFRGRIIRPVTDFLRSTAIEVEGALAYLNDSVVGPFEFPDGFPEAATSANVVATLFQWLLAGHNSQVSTEQQIKPGTVTVTDPNNYIARSQSGYSTTMDAIKGKLLEPLGGYLIMRYEADGNYLDYVSELPLTNVQPVEFGYNLIDLVKERDGAEIYTDILPVGKDGLTILEETDGNIGSDLVKSGKIIYSRSARQNFGQIVRVVEWKDVTQAQNLKTKAAQELAGNGILTTESITASAVDMGFTPEAVAKFRVGRNAVTSSAPHDIAGTFPLLALDIDVNDPGATGITLGRTAKTLSAGEIDTQRANAEALDYQQLQLEQVKADASGINEETRTQITEAVQNSQTIILSAMEEYTRTGDFEQFKQTTQAQLQLLSDSLTITISGIQQDITTLSGDVQQQLQEWRKYFRFTQDGMMIGETGSDTMLQLDNDIMQILRNYFPVWWADESGTHTDSLEARIIRIGDIELIEHSNHTVVGRKGR